MYSTVIRRLRIFLLPPKLPWSISFAALRSLSALAATPGSPSAQPDPKMSLSARLSFVFDQIDALERQRDTSAKDEALQRIRAWRQSKHPPPLPSSSRPADAAEADTQGGSNGSDTHIIENAHREETGMAELFRREVEVVHPWPEWIELMERLASQNYFDYRRAEESRVTSNVGIDISTVKEEVGLDLTRDWAAVRAACMNFGRDRFDILKSLSRKDIQVLVGHGCPSMDPKVVFSAKLLRKYVHLDEGDVCSSCSLRNSCSRGYILVPKEDEARTLDVLRVLLTYGFDHTKESVENDFLRKKKTVKTVVRKLLHEVVKLSAVPRDPNLLPPVIKKPPPKVKQPPPQPKRRVGRDDVEMKKGDWLCSKCDFMNFAKNTVCLQCDAKRPKRQLLPGEWECPKCNFLNYRRNMSCFQCEHDRPPDEFTEKQTLGKRMSPNTRLQRATRTSDVSNAWNFDFDDDESDGADVAAFEFADHGRANDCSSFNELPGRENTGEIEDDIAEHQDRGRCLYSSGKGGSLSHSRVTGFDDFDDEEEDSVDNYELAEANGKETHSISRKSLSDFDSGSELDDFDDHDRYANSSQHRKDYLSDSEDNDILVSAHNIADSSDSFNSGDDAEPSSNFNHDTHGKLGLKQRKKVQQNAIQMSFGRGSYSDYDGGRHVSDDDDLYSSRSKKGIKGASERPGRNFQDSFNFGSKSNGRSNFGGDDDGNDSLHSRGSRNRGSRGGSKSAGRMFQDSNRVSSNDIGRNSFTRHEYKRIERRGDYKRVEGRGDSDLTRRVRNSHSSNGARGILKSGAKFKGNGYGRSNDGHEYRQSVRMTDRLKDNYRQYENNGHGKGRYSGGKVRYQGLNDDNGFGDHQRRRIIER